MSQVNVNEPNQPPAGPPVAPAPVDGSGIGFIVGILLAVLIIALLVWFLIINPGANSVNNTGGGNNTGNQATPSPSAWHLVELA